MKAIVSTCPLQRSIKWFVYNVVTLLGSYKVSVNNYLGTCCPSWFFYTLY